jgi:hypothetical protein
MHMEKGHIVENEVEARAGFLDRPVLAVLVVSVSLLLALYVLVYYFHFGS